MATITVTKKKKTKDDKTIKVKKTVTRNTKKKRTLKVLYDCSVCPAYCCTYADIGINRTDIKRIAKHFDIPVETAIKRYAREVDGKLRLRHRRDEYFKTACRFLGNDRRCTIYEARPGVCRIFPDERKCGYYDFLMWERERQDDPNCIP